MLRVCAMFIVVTVAAVHVWAAPLVPNDPYYAAYEWYGPVLNLPAAWGYSLGSASVVVAVLDSGVMSNTPDLAGRVMRPMAPPGLPVMDGSLVRHGTWVASTLAMGVNNGIGGAGVGNFTILPVVVNDQNGYTTASWISKGIRMAADAGARVINVSQIITDYATLDEAAAYARSKGALTFICAGNANARNPMTGYENLIFVAGTMLTSDPVPVEQRWDEGPGLPGSTWGPFVDLSAPAHKIVVADPTFGSGYGQGSGTSFAAPFAAGAAALAWSINPTLSADEVLALLEQTAVDLGERGWDEVFGHGRIDIGAVAAGAYAALPEPATAGLLAAGVALAAVRRLRRSAARRAARPRA
ncbi:MAG: hypothetical protein FJ288_17540 [Planctomycetes bacterium]|nr:hypothetical protein [Planctomycetota bacterium]